MILLICLKKIWVAMQNPPQALVPSSERRCTIERGVIQNTDFQPAHTPNSVGVSCGEDSAHAGLVQGDDNRLSPTAESITVVAHDVPLESSKPLADAAVMHSVLSGRGVEATAQNSRGDHVTSVSSLATLSPASDATTEARPDSPTHDTKGRIGSAADEKNDDPSGTSDRAPPVKASSIGVVKAVTDAATDLARECSIPGISEAAALVSILVQLVSDHRGSTRMVESNLRWCLTVVVMLKRAAKVLRQVRSRYQRSQYIRCRD